jgi:putative heme iron utilization protein
MSDPDLDDTATPFDAATTVRRLVRTSRWGTLASLRQGGPYASLIAVASDLDGTPLTLISRLAWHTRNLEADPRVSLLLAETGSHDPLSQPRVSIAATAERADAGTVDAARLRRRFLARHPEAELYAGFGDFATWRLVPGRAHLVAGFGRIVDIAPAEFMTDLADAADLIAAEEGALAHLNADHAEALQLYATRLLGASGGDWRATSLDPEGLDLDNGARTLRLAFPRRVASPDALRHMLKALADAARATGG